MIARYCYCFCIKFSQYVCLNSWFQQLIYRTLIYSYQLVDHFLVTHDNRRVLFLYVTLRLGTLDATSVVEWLTPETNISHQVYRRVWPTTQREALFWSTIQHHPSDDDEAPDCWIVVNHSTEHENVPVNLIYRNRSLLSIFLTLSYVFDFRLVRKWSDWGSTLLWYVKL